MRKFYCSPEVYLVSLENLDVITTSTENYDISVDDIIWDEEAWI